MGFMEKKLAICLTLAKPRGFCAGVERAILIVERALEKYGAPIYVRHEIVHNRFVVEALEAKGAIFVSSLADIPDGERVIFSAHGVAKKVPQNAQQRGLHYLDATCPLVSKVHREAERFHEQGYRIILIGHSGHPEVVGTMGQLPEGAIELVETIADIATLPPSDKKTACITQTTLSIDDTAAIIKALEQKLGKTARPPKEDICYATTNRQLAVKELAKKVDYMLIIGGKHSSNSQRLVEVAQAAGCQAEGIEGASAINWQTLAQYQHIGLSAGASAPEALIAEVVAAFQKRFQIELSEREAMAENVSFKLPLELREA